MSKRQPQGPIVTEVIIMADKPPVRRTIPDDPYLPREPAK